MENERAPAGAGAEAQAPSLPTRREWFRAAALATVVAVVAGGLTGLGVTQLLRGRSVTTLSFSPNRSAFHRLDDVPALSASVLPSVVTILAVAPSCSAGSDGGDEFAGTGMVIDGRGDILTNNHVVSHATHISVDVDHDPTALRATLIGADPASDVALIRIDLPHGVPAVHFAPSSAVQVGESVVAIGNALALDQHAPSVTAGIISGERRNITANGDCAGSEHLTGLIQTQAAINPGNSGGPLFDAAGQVVGMNTAGAVTTPEGTPAQNVGFAIPVWTLKSLLPGLETGGTEGIGLGYLGVAASNASGGDLPAGSGASGGALLDEVQHHSPASAAGLQPGDVIVEFAGHPVTSARSIQSLVRETRPGTRVALTYYRNGTRSTVEVVVGRQRGI